jgi:hypothetical protein
MRAAAQGGAQEGRLGAKLRWQLQAHRDWVMGVCYAPQLKALLGAGLDKAVTINDLEARLPIKRLLVSTWPLLPACSVMHAFDACPGCSSCCSKTCTVPLSHAASHHD